MANLFPPQYPQQLDFFPAAKHTHPQRSFGFALSPNTFPAHPFNSHQPPLPPHQQARGGEPSHRGLAGSKRRHERDDDDDDQDQRGNADDQRPSRNDDMDRSPTPERPKRAAPKRVRIDPDENRGATDKHKHPSDGAKAQEDSLDVGVLLARLPPQSLLPILMSLISAQPNLKSRVLELIPRPTLEIALDALADAARKLRDAYPYSQPAPPAAASFGFGSANASTFGRVGHYFGSHPAATAQPRASAAGGMRDEYVLSRMGPPIAEFVSTATSYLSYFSLIAAPSAATPAALLAPRLQPSETFSFLSALTGHIFAQPPLTVSALVPQMQTRIGAEWNAWLQRIDAAVNHEGGMYAADVVHGWLRDLDRYAAEGGALGVAMRALRDEWLRRVGWLIGRRAPSVNMDADEEL